MSQSDRSSRGWTARIALAGRLGTLFLGSLGGAAIAVAAQQGAQPQSPPRLSLFEQHAGQAKLKNCASLYPTLGAMVAEGAIYNVASAWDTKAPDSHPMRGLVGLTLDTPGYRAPGAGVVFAVPQSQGCAGGAVRVVPFPKTCAEIAKQLPAGSRLVRELSGTPLYEIGERAGQVMLLNNQTGCVAISINQIG